MGKYSDKTEYLNRNSATHERLHCSSPYLFSLKLLMFTANNNFSIILPLNPHPPSIFSGYCLATRTISGGQSSKQSNQYLDMLAPRGWRGFCRFGYSKLIQKCFKNKSWVKCYGGNLGRGGYLKSTKICLSPLGSNTVIFCPRGILQLFRLQTNYGGRQICEPKRKGEEIAEVKSFLIKISESEPNKESNERAMRFTIHL